MNSFTVTKLGSIGHSTDTVIFSKFQDFKEFLEVQTKFKECFSSWATVLLFMEEAENLVACIS